ncbi:hypothetical protein HCBAA847_1830 [Helicobacter cinaedi CCUG 18818 = ATCC BAA-847]|uniref:Uncharacterized protein n=2 Tax=Helicobacter cinaedi TaxID=213 RepID=A0AAI8MNM9_9HELI|nr:hypothetical protein [Helicobacter cinaedi]BAM33050.1 hypothetical protein HCBAA847_1830 [Helicobacter cinaedi CCUG 18818 = ATCC BAA-847]
MTNVYRARFEADFNSIDTIIAWVESHIIMRESKLYHQPQGVERGLKRDLVADSKADLKVNSIKILRKGKDKIALVLCEYVGNIIEHSILCLSKTQLYNGYKNNMKARKKYIECVLKVRATHFILESCYPFTPKSCYKRDELKIGKKGKKILNLMGAKSRVVIKRAKTPFVRSSLCVEIQKVFV